MTTPSNMAASRFKYSTLQLRKGEFSLAQWSWYWLINRAALVRIPPGSHISAMHLFISFFVRKGSPSFYTDDILGGYYNQYVPPWFKWIKFGSVHMYAVSGAIKIIFSSLQTTR